MDQEHDHEVPAEELTEDVDFEPEDELGSVGALKEKLKKVRAELAQSQKERAEYLDGWQRCKAETINVRREALEEGNKRAQRLLVNLVEEIIPALDSFDMAMAHPSWQSVDSAWRGGVEGIKAQLEAALKAHDVEVFGKEGETLDPALHEAMQEEEGGTSHTVARVIRKGYRLGGRILRPAQVVVYS